MCNCFVSHKVSLPLNLLYSMNIALTFEESGGADPDEISQKVSSPLNLLLRVA